MRTLNLNVIGDGLVQYHLVELVHKVKVTEHEIEELKKKLETVAPECSKDVQRVFMTQLEEKKSELNRLKFEIYIFSESLDGHISI